MTDDDHGSYHDVREPEDERRRLLTAFLRHHRSRIDPTIPVLGQHPRRAQAVGKLVTPREIADAADVNPRWYELAERGEPTRASGAVLRALGNVLGLSLQERAVLLRLASPPIEQRGPRGDSLEVRDAYSFMRPYLRKLNACSTADEILALAKETAASVFPEVAYLVTGSRFPDGGWVHRGEAIAKRSRLSAFASMQANVLVPIFDCDPAAADALTCFPELSMPGDLCTQSDRDETRVAAILGDAYDAFKAVHGLSAAAVIRSRSGFFAHLVLGDFRESYDDDVNRAMISAIVDFASLALSA